MTVALADPLPVAIVGGGPAGMALALALHRQGIRCAIHDARSRRAGADDPRVLALSHGARQILEWLGAWRDIPHTPIATIHVSQAGHLGRTLLTAGEHAVPALGYVLAARDLIAALDRALEGAAVEYRENSRIDTARPGEDRVEFEGSAGAGAARLLAFAEGGIAGEEARRRDYGQHAVICRVTSREAHRNLAFERFTPAGPVALLPMGNAWALVLTCPDGDSARIAALPDAEFLALLQCRFGHRLRFEAAGPRAVFPLGLRYREAPVAARQVWVGNAAQTLHPVAGQGFNLALRDIWQLADSVGSAVRAAGDPGAPEVLAAYAGARRLDRRGAMGFTDVLVRVFGGGARWFGHARGAGLLALDLVPPARDFLARRMMFGARAW
ncbi:MAG: FAD-dependent monooxygenase [Rhodocyclaceae bacterium]|nr:FAD-dependent monooxygenase [Rhodocyclaceae bacterium]